jgi:hypothetical protein
MGSGGGLCYQAALYVFHCTHKYAAALLVIDAFGVPIRSAVHERGG